MTSQLLVGKVLRVLEKDTVNVQVVQYVLDKFLMAYFKERTNYDVLDEKRLSNTGDWVLLEQLPERFSLEINHRVKKVIWMNGNIIDPITGKKCFNTFLQEDLDREALIMGGKPLSKLVEEFYGKNKDDTKNVASEASKEV